IRCSVSATAFRVCRNGGQHAAQSAGSPCCRSISGSPRVAGSLLPDRASRSPPGGPTPRRTEQRTMPTITTTDGTTIFYKDWGPKSAQALVFHHGWPLSADEWDAQMLFFLSQGYRVIAHDRRGHGRSSQPDTGNEMDTYAADVIELAR